MAITSPQVIDAAVEYDHAKPSVSILFPATKSENKWRDSLSTYLFGNQRMSTSRCNQQVNAHQRHKLKMYVHGKERMAFLAKSNQRILRDRSYISPHATDLAKPRPLQSRQMHCCSYTVLREGGLAWFTGTDVHEKETLPCCTSRDDAARSRRTPLCLNA